MRSPHPPSCGSFTSSGGGRHSAAPVRPHLVGVTNSKDLELLGVLPGLVAPDHGNVHKYHSNASMLSSYIPRGGLRTASVTSAVRGDLDGRRHDVSYLRDKPGHGKQPKHGEWTDVNVPPTKIPRDARVVETSMLKGGNPCFEEWYNPAEKLWHRIVFPAKRPSNREQVLLLERWMTKILATHAETSGLARDTNNDHPETSAIDGYGSKPGSAEREAPWRWQNNMNAMTGDKGREGRGEVVGSGPGHGQSPAGIRQPEGGIGQSQKEREGNLEVEEKEAAMIRAQMSVLMLGFYEIVRQVAQHCTERGRLLHRIWRSLNDLFEYVLREMADTVASCERRLAAMSRLLGRERAENEAREETHRNELQMVEELLNGRWSKKVRQMREQEVKQGKLVAENERTVELLLDWLPNFGGYADSVLAKLLPPRAPSTGDTGVDAIAPQDALERDLRRIQSAGLWAVVQQDDAGDSLSQASDSSAASSSSRDDSETEHSDRDGRAGSGNDVGSAAEEATADGGTTGVNRTARKHRSEIMNTSEKPVAGGKDWVTVKIGLPPAEASKPQQEKNGASSLLLPYFNTPLPQQLRSPVAATAGGIGQKRGTRRATSEGKSLRTRRKMSHRKGPERNLMAVFMRQGQEATAQADALRREVAEANKAASSVSAGARKDALQLVQACGRAQGAILSLLADPTPRIDQAFPGLLQILGMTATTEHVSIIRTNPPLGVAGVHCAVVSATRALLAFRRESAVAATTQATTAAPAAGSLSRRRLEEFLYETELRRSGKVMTARRVLRRLLASLLFWSPLPVDARNGTHAEDDVEGRVDSKIGEGADDNPDTGHDGEHSGSILGAPPYSAAEECLWLRIFSAVESHARPCRSEPVQGPTKPELVPLEQAISAIRAVFGQSPDAPGIAGVALPSAAAAGPRDGAHGLARTKQTKEGGWDEALRQGNVANPWFLIDRGAVESTVGTLKTAAAKHGGSHVELFDITGAALNVGYRANRVTLLRTLTLVAEVADLGGELTFGTVSMVMHVASPALPEFALRLLFYRAATMQRTHRTHSRPPSSRGAGGGNSAAGERTTRTTVEGDAQQSSGRAASRSAGGGGGTEAVTPADLARAVVEFPLACEGLAPLIHASASVHGPRELLKQVAFQAKEAIQETEKIIEAIKKARTAEADGVNGGGGDRTVRGSEVEAVEARTSQLKAFVTNAETTRNALDVSKLWISRRMLATESALLRTYGGILPTLKAQDAIRQGRRVRMRYVMRQWWTAWQDRAISRPSDSNEATKCVMASTSVRVAPTNEIA